MGLWSWMPKGFALGTLRVASRSPTPTSKTKGFLGPFDSLGGLGPPFPGDFGASGRFGPELKHIHLKLPSGGQLRTGLATYRPRCHRPLVLCRREIEFEVVPGADSDCVLNAGARSGGFFGGPSFAGRRPKLDEN